MSDNKRIGGKANDGKNGRRRRKYLRLKKKIRIKTKKEAGLLKSNKINKKMSDSKPVLKKTAAKKPAAKKSAAKK